MKRKRKDVCHALEFAKRFESLDNALTDVEGSSRKWQAARSILERSGDSDAAQHATMMIRTGVTANKWLETKQCYELSKEFAEDLFAMDIPELSVNSLHLPFPCIYVDMEAAGGSVHGETDMRLLGCYICVSRLHINGKMAWHCSVVELGIGENDEYGYLEVGFSHDPESGEPDPFETFAFLTKKFPKESENLRRAILFAAYLSSEQPDVIENEAQKAIYRPSEKPKFSSVRKWDVGVRYAQEMRKRREAGADAEGSGSREGKPHGQHRPHRPHMRRAHWHTYRTGKGRTGRKLLWIPPIAVGVPKGQKDAEMPAVIRTVKGEAR